MEEARDGTANQVSFTEDKLEVKQNINLLQNVYGYLGISLVILIMVFTVLQKVCNLYYV